jgi:hypothetical protein
LRVGLRIALTVVLRVAWSCTLRSSHSVALSTGRVVTLALRPGRLTLTKSIWRTEAWRSPARKTSRPRRRAQYLSKVESPANIVTRLLVEVQRTIVDLDQLVIVVTLKLVRECRLEC